MPKHLTQELPRRQSELNRAPHYQEALTKAIVSITSQGRYRVFADLERKAGACPLARRHAADATGRDRVEDVTVWCSNDYLGMGQHPKVLAAMHDTLDRCGAGAGRRTCPGGGRWAAAGTCAVSAAAAPPRAVAMAVREEDEIGDTKIHIRGSIRNLGEKVPRGFITVASIGKATRTRQTRVRRRQWQ